MSQSMGARVVEFGPHLARRKHNVSVLERIVGIPSVSAELTPEDEAADPNVKPPSVNPADTDTRC